MNGKQLVLHFLALMFCACLPMTPVMSAAVEVLTPGFVSEYYGNSSADLPLRSQESERWDLLQIRAPEAWEISNAGEDVVVAVLDTGIDINHRSLKGKVIDCESFTVDTEIDTIRGHGTHVAGIIAAVAESTENTGLAYNSTLLDVRVAENDGTTDALKVARGIIWAVDHGARVINISIVIGKPYDTLEKAVNYAWEKGCLIVAAAGNSASTEPVYPASYPHVIAVSATDKNDCLARWSNHGDWVSVAAPGVSIYSTLPGNKFGYKSGTSFATALVSGEAAMLFTRAVDLNNNGRVNDEVRDYILNNCDHSEEMENSERRINVFNASKNAQTDQQFVLADRRS